MLFAGRPGVPEELDILAEVIPMAKGIYTQYQNADRVGLKRIDPKSDRLHRRYAGALSPGRPDFADRRAHGQAGKPLVAHHLSQADLAHRNRAQRSALRLHVRQRQCRRRHHGGSDQPAVPPAGQRPADDHHAARRLPRRSRRFRGVGAVPHGVRFRPVERRRLAAAVRLRGSASLRRPPTATSASARPARRSRASPRKAANTASISASSRSGRPNSTPPSSPSATRCSRCALPTTATRRCCARRSRTPPPICCRSCPRSAPARCWRSAKAWRCRRGCASRKCRSHQLPRSEATIATVPSVAAGHDMHFVSAVLERWRGATSHRDVPNDPMHQRTAGRAHAGTAPGRSADAAAVAGPRSRPLLAAEEAAALTVREPVSRMSSRCALSAAPSSPMIGQRPHRAAKAGTFP